MKSLKKSSQYVAYQNDHSTKRCTVSYAIIMLPPLHIVTGESPAALISNRRMRIHFPEVMIQLPNVTIAYRDAIQKSKMMDIVVFQLKPRACIH